MEWGKSMPKGITDISAPLLFGQGSMFQAGEGSRWSPGSLNVGSGPGTL